MDRRMGQLNRNEARRYANGHKKKQADNVNLNLKINNDL